MNSPIGWIGGKRALRKRSLHSSRRTVLAAISKCFSALDGCFRQKEKQPGQLEVINDRDGQIVNLFRCIKYHRAALREELEWALFPRVRYSSLPWLNCTYRWPHRYSACGTLFLRAQKKFFRKQSKTFATSGNGIGCSIDYLEQVQLRLKSVKIENRDFEPIFETYDRPDALFLSGPSISWN